MNLPQDQLKAFFEVARLGSFTKAAAHLGLTQSALSHRIKNLEGYLETTLFVRANDGIRLTEAGDKLLKYTRVQSQIENEFINDLKVGSSIGLSGSLRIGGASTVMWPLVIPALSKFIRTNPSVQIEMSVRELADLPSLLQSGEVDLIITCGKINRHQYEEIYLGDEINVLVESNKFGDIPEVYLDHHPDDRTTIEYLKIHDDKIQKLNRSYYDDINGILAAAEAGFGRAVIPLHMLGDRKSLQVVRGERKLKVPVYLCYLKQPFYSKLHLAALEVIKKGIPPLLAP
jgi:DNA-binding transcriptional LysR family regulator